MQLVITPNGTVRCIHSDVIPLKALGRPQIERASHVEPTADGDWTADLSPVHGPLLGPFSTRGEALEAEHRWLETHWLINPETGVVP